MLLADKILTIKPYDAAGDNAMSGSSHGRTFNNGEYRKQYGSDYWADSNIRSWLNSTATAGNVNWLCGNAPTTDNVWNGYNDYATEKGFMADGNFTESERSAVKAVMQKSLLNGYEYSSTINDTYHTWGWHILSVVQNYDTAYSEQVADRMFLLDVKQVNKVYQNLGYYYKGQPTQKAVDNSEYKDDYLSSSKIWSYYLRSPYPVSGSPDFVRYVDLDGSVDYGRVNSDSIGVRPAFYINQSAVIFKSGTGAVGMPYVATSTGRFLNITSATVTGVSSTGFIANVEINAENNSRQKLQGKLAFALYDNATNMLVTVKTIDCTLDSNNSTTRTETFEIGNFQYKVKVFWWEGFTYTQPLSESAEKIFTP